MISSSATTKSVRPVISDFAKPTTVFAMKYLLTLLLFVVAMTVQAQTPTQRRADRYYDRLAYARQFRCMKS